MMGFIKLLSFFLSNQRRQIDIMERSSWVYHENYQNVSNYDSIEMEKYIREVMTGYHHDGVIYDRTEVIIIKLVIICKRGVMVYTYKTRRDKKDGWGVQWILDL